MMENDMDFSFPPSAVRVEHKERRVTKGYHWEPLQKYEFF